jgi:hypothetical protein
MRAPCPSRSISAWLATMHVTCCVQASRARLSARLMAQGVPLYYSLPAPLQANDAQSASSLAQQAEHAQQGAATPPASAPGAQEGVLSLDQIDRVMMEVVKQTFTLEEQVWHGSTPYTWALH